MNEPLNVWSMSPELLGRELSNFAHTPFTLDGLEFGSVEAFYVWLMLSASGNEHKREKVRPMWGLHAKRLFPKRRPAEVCYRGTWMIVGGADHIAVIKSALRRKLRAHAEIARRFAATRPRLIVHETGHPDKPDAEFPRETFCRLLCELREELAMNLHSE